MIGTIASPKPSQTWNLPLVAGSALLPLRPSCVSRERVAAGLATILGADVDADPIGINVGTEYRRETSSNTFSAHAARPQRQQRAACDERQVPRLGGFWRGNCADHPGQAVLPLAQPARRGSRVRLFHC